LRDAGISVVEGVSVKRQDFFAGSMERITAAMTWSYPVFIKPSIGGSSVGCRMVPTEDDLAPALEFAFQFCDEVLIERAVDAREVECAVLGNAEQGFEASCLGEIVPGSEFYDYEDKYLNDSAGLHAPAHLDEHLTAAIRAQAVEAFAALGGTGMARVDFFVESDGAAAKVMLNEINTLPGFTDISMYPKLWALSGKPLEALCAHLVEIAIEDHKSQARVDGSIRDWVQELENKTSPPQ